MSLKAQTDIRRANRNRQRRARVERGRASQERMQSAVGSFDWIGGVSHCCLAKVLRLQLAVDLVVLQAACLEGNLDLHWAWLERNLVQF